MKVPELEYIKTYDVLCEKAKQGVTIVWHSRLPILVQMLADMTEEDRDRLKAHAKEVGIQEEMFIDLRDIRTKVVWRDNKVWMHIAPSIMPPCGDPHCNCSEEESEKYDAITQAKFQEVSMRLPHSFAAIKTEFDISRNILKDLEG